MTAPSPHAPALIALTEDHCHYLHAAEAYIEGGLLVALIDGRWRAWPATGIYKVRWLFRAEERAA